MQVSRSTYMIEAVDKAISIMIMCSPVEKATVWIISIKGTVTIIIIQKLSPFNSTKYCIYSHSGRVTLLIKHHVKLNL